MFVFFFLSVICCIVLVMFSFTVNVCVNKGLVSDKSAQFNASIVVLFYLYSLFEIHNS